MRDCAPLAPYIDETSRDACQLDPDIRIPSEDVGLFHGGSLSLLLGNNPIWTSGQEKPVNASYVDDSSWNTWGRVGSLQEGVGSLGSSPSTINSTSGIQVNPFASGWEMRGCISEVRNGRALEGVAITDQAEMNLRECAVLCEGCGYSVAGIEFGRPAQPYSISLCFSTYSFP